jgi:ABC-type antimicrobial peptide transport system, permease component
VVSEIRGPNRVVPNRTFDIELELRNLASTQQRESLTVTVGEKTQSIQVALASQQTTQKTVSFRLQTPRTYTVSVAAVKRSLQVVEPSSLTLPDEFPQRAPPDATLLVPSVTTNETIVEAATVTIGDQTTQTGSRGAATIGVPSTPGEYTVTVSKQGYESASVPLIVDPAVNQRLRAQLSVNPSTGTSYTRPEITVRVANPWGEFVVRNLTLTAPGTAESRTVEFPSGNVTELTFDGREIGFTEEVAPGRYPLTLYADGNLLARTTYRVEEASGGSGGSPRPQGEYASGTGVGRAIENVFGNVQVLFFVMIVLAGVSTIGGTTAAFAQAVQSRRQDIGIYRATGATQRQLLWLLASDAFRVAVPAGILSFIGVYIVVSILSRAGLLVMFGVQLSVPLTPLIAVSTLMIAMLLSIVSAVVAGWVFLRGDVVGML